MREADKISQPILEIIASDLSEGSKITMPEILEIKDYIDSPLTKKNLKWHIDTTKSAMNVVKEYIKLAEEMEKKVSDAASYSLILRLRTLYIIDCLRKDKIWKKKEFLGLIKKISGSLIAYERYLDSKNNNTNKFRVNPYRLSNFFCCGYSRIDICRKNVIRRSRHTHNEF